MEISADFLNELQNLKGLECWRVIAGEGTGSRITLSIGRKIERTRPLRNPQLPSDLRQFDSEFVIFVQDCAWRLNADKVICTSKTPNNNDGPMVAGLHSLVGQQIVAVTASAPSYDLVVEFSDSSKLHLFCDCFDSERDGDNYSFHSLHRVFAVGASGALALESRRIP